MESADWSFRQPGELAPGNEIRLYEGSDSALNGVFQVNEKGKLILPYEVEVLVEGLQIEEVKNLLNRRFRQFLRNPNFQVSVEGQEVYVHLQGLVEKPGSYLISSDSSLDEILLNAGGLLKSADKRARARYVRITQFGKPRLVNLQDYYSGTADLIPSWQGGESLFFQYEGSSNVSADREYIHVLGEVLSPGAYPFSSQLDILAYLTEAGGPTDRADLSRMTLLSREDGGLRQAHFDFDDVRTLPSIQPGDTLIIPSSNPTGLERGTGIAASLAAVLSSIGLIAIGL
jgi:protein involved in polysaccharide export with SLBB domain